MSNLDVTATIIAAGCTRAPNGAPDAQRSAASALNALHSRDLLPVCNPTSPDAAAVFAQHHGHGERLTQRVIITERYKYVACLYDRNELYDLAEDPYELNNLEGSPGHADVRNELREKILEEIARTNDRSANYLAAAMRAGF